MKNINSRIETYLGYTLAICSTLLYLYLGVNYSVNMPVSDDYGAILQFLQSFSQTDSFAGKLSVLFSQHNAHIVLVYRLVFVLQYLVFGSVNFLVPIYLGNLLWLLTVIMAFKSLQVKHVLHLGIACVLILNWQYYIATVWGTLLFYTLFLGVCSFVLIQKNSWVSFAGSLVSAGLAIFTAGNGIIVPVLLVAYFVIQKRFCSRFWITLGTSILLLSLYFSVFFSIPLSEEGYVKGNMMLQIIQYVYIFLTANLYGMYELPEISTAVVFSLIGCAVYLYCGYFIVKNKYYESNPTLVLLLFFISGTAIVTAFGRVGFGIFQAASFRYRMLPSLFTAVLILMYFDASYGSKQKKQAVIKWSLIILSCVIFISSLQTFSTHAQLFKNAGISGAFLFKNKIAQDELPYINDSNVPAQILDQSVKAGLFTLPEYLVQDVDVWREDTVKIQLHKETDLTIRSEIRVSSITNTYTYLSVKKSGEIEYDLYLALINDSDTLLFELIPQAIKQQYIYRNCHGIILDIEKYRTNFSKVLFIEQHFNESRTHFIGKI